MALYNIPLTASPPHLLCLRCVAADAADADGLNHCHGLPTAAKQHTDEPTGKWEWGFVLTPMAPAPSGIARQRCFGPHAVVLLHAAGFAEGQFLHACTNSPPNTSHAFR